MADGPRYRMCGNGVGRVIAAWIGRRIAAAEGELPRGRRESLPRMPWRNQHAQIWLPS